MGQEFLGNQAVEPDGGPRRSPSTPSFTPKPSFFEVPYNIVPYLTRFRGYRGGDFDSHKNERERLIELTGKAGFDFVDMADLALHEIDVMGTQFAALTLFVDHAHWSPIGTMKMAEHLTARRNSERPSDAVSAPQRSSRLLGPFGGTVVAEH